MQHLLQVKPLMDSLEGARKAKADADASLKVSNDLVAAVEAKLQQLQDKFMEVYRCIQACAESIIAVFHSAPLLLYSTLSAVYLLNHSAWKSLSKFREWT